MNYYNPYFYSIPTNIASTPTRTGIFSKLLGGSKITLGGILNGTQKVLTFANQAIPLVQQVRPLIGNAKTMFKVMNEFKKTDIPSNNNIKQNTINTSSTNTTTNLTTTEFTEENQNNNTLSTSEDGPTFFI